MKRKSQKTVTGLAERVRELAAKLDYEIALTDETADAYESDPMQRVKLDMKSAGLARARDLLREYTGF